MATPKPAAARLPSYAHLGDVSDGARAEGGGKGTKAAKAEGDDDDENKPKDDDDKKAKGKGAAAADDQNDDDGKDDGKDDDKKSKKAKSKAKDDDDGESAEDEDADEEMHGKSAAAAARRRERARCAAIFGSKAAGRNPALAARLAFHTTLTRSEAIETLEETPMVGNASAERHDARGARNPNMTPSGGAGPTPKQATTASWDKAFASVGGHGDRPQRQRH